MGALTANNRLSVGLSTQFSCVSVVIERPGATADEIIRLADSVKARYHDGEDDCVVVDDRTVPAEQQVGPEVYTESALRRSFKG